MVKNPADYRWSSYGEAIGGGNKGNGKKARAGLVRALGAHKGYEADARHWAGRVSREYRMLLLEGAAEVLGEVVGGGTVEAGEAGESGDGGKKVLRKGMEKSQVDAELERLRQGGDVALGKLLRCRIRYFTDGVVIGSRGFVDEVFARTRERFGPRRKDGARKVRGAEGQLWSLRDLRKGVG